MDSCVKVMLISGLMEFFLMLFPSVPRTVSKCVSVEKDKYLNYTDLSSTNIP